MENSFAYSIHRLPFISSFFALSSHLFFVEQLRVCVCAHDTLRRVWLFPPPFHLQKLATSFWLHTRESALPHGMAVGVEEDILRMGWMGLFMMGEGEGGRMDGSVQNHCNSVA